MNLVRKKWLEEADGSIPPYVMLHAGHLVLQGERFTYGETNENKAKRRQLKAKELHLFP